MPLLEYRRPFGHFEGKELESLLEDAFSYGDPRRSGRDPDYGLVVFFSRITKLVYSQAASPLLVRVGSDDRLGALATPANPKGG